MLVAQLKYTKICIKIGYFVNLNMQGKKSFDAIPCGVYQALQSSYSAQKVCADPPLRYFKQQLETRETPGSAIRFKDQDPGGKTQNAAQ